MTPPVRPEQDPLEALKALRPPSASSGLDPLEQLKALRPAKPDIHAEYRSGRLAKRMARENQNDLEAAQADEVSTPAAIRSVLATGANLAQGIPGMEAVQAGARSLATHAPNLGLMGGVTVPLPRTERPESYSEALSDIRGEVGKIPGKLGIAERVAGALPLTKFLPKSPALAGGIIGGADQALSADPDQSIAGRAVRTVGGAAASAVLGKAGESAVTGLRAIRAPGAAKNLLAQQAARTTSSNQLYGKALTEGQGRTATPEIHHFLKDASIEEIVDELKQTRPFQAVAKDAPEMLDAVYKVLSDRAAQVKRGLQAVTPTRPNIGRYQAQDIGAAKGDLLDAISGGAAAPGPMPTYRKAVTDYADRSGVIDATQKGYDALRTASRNALPRSANLTRTTPEALGQWGQTASPDEIAAAGEGVLGGVKDAWHGIRGTTAGRHALSRAPNLLRQINEPRQTLMDALVNAGVIGANGLATSQTPPDRP